MSRHSPFTIRLSRKEREILESRARKYTLPYFEVLRAKIILLAAEGSPNDAIATALSVGRDVVSLWRKRFFHERLPGLEERPRPGRPRVFPPQSWWYRSRPSPVNCLPPVGCLCRALVVPTLCARRSSAASLRASATRRCGAGCTRTPFDPGSTAPGSSHAIRISRAKPGASSICTPSAWEGQAPALRRICALHR